ncbi:MAG: ABC transporter permease [Acidobacteriia bacterium]|nr:ABC transporter permease [Terriglobia bacterium]
MNTQSNAVPESPLDSRVIAPAIMSPTRPLYWSIRRELWENRSIYVAPLVAAAVFLFAFLISAIHRLVTGTLDPAKQQEALARPYGFAAGLIMATTVVVGVFYCLDALHGERRDRSILFWKSLPVSDLTTVLSKASIPLVVLPLLTFAITVATQWIMLLLSTAARLASGRSVTELWTQLSWFQMSLMLLYHLLTVHALWHAPMYSWLLLVSGWARRATFLWAALPLFAIGIIEKVAFNTSHFAAMLAYRMTGPEGYTPTARGGDPMYPMATLELGRFLSTPGLWIGLAVAAAFLAAAVRLRRYRGPI